jgi:hypothetical protein
VQLPASQAGFWPMNTGEEESVKMFIYKVAITLLTDSGGGSLQRVTWFKGLANEPFKVH